MMVKSSKQWKREINRDDRINITNTMFETPVIYSQSDLVMVFL